MTGNRSLPLPPPPVIWVVSLLYLVLFLMYTYKKTHQNNIHYPLKKTTKKLVHVAATLWTTYIPQKYNDITNSSLSEQAAILFHPLIQTKLVLCMRRHYFPFPFPPLPFSHIHLPLSACCNMATKEKKEHCSTRVYSTQNLMK